MRELVSNSVFCRCCSSLIKTWRVWWQASVVARVITSLRDSYASSRINRLWTTWGNKDSCVLYSRYHKVVAGVSRGLESFGTIFKESVFYRLIRMIPQGWFYLCQKSSILAFISRISLHQWFLVLFAFYLPIEFIVRDTLHLGGFAPIWEELFLLIAAMMVVWRRVLKQTEAGQRTITLDVWLLLFFAVGFFLMSVNQPFPEVALLGYRIVAEKMLWFFIIIRLIENERDLKVFLWSFILMATLLALHGIYQYIIGVEMPSKWVTYIEASDVRTRVYSLTGSPNILGSLLMLIAPLIAAMIYFLKQTWQKIIAAGVLGCFLLAILFTFSRGAWVGLVVAVVVFAIFVDKRLLALMISAIAAILVFVPSITSRLTLLFTDYYAAEAARGGRPMRWEAAQELLFNHNPWIGFGLGRFGGAVANSNRILSETADFRYLYMDNYYMKTLVEMGFIGLGAYILLLAALLILGMKAIQRSGEVFSGDGRDPLQSAIGNYRVIAIGIYSGFVGVITHCYFENIFEEPYMTAYFWGLAAALMYLGFFRDKDKDKSPPVNN